MTDNDLPDDRLDGDRLQGAFQHGGAVGHDPRNVDADGFLARVHRGGRRRRARRTAGAVASTAAAVAIVATGMAVVVDDLAPAEAPVAQGETTPQASTEPPGEGTPTASGEQATSDAASARVPPGPLSAYDLQVPDDRSVWALASPDCGRAALCPVVVHSTDQGKTWQELSPSGETSDGDIKDFRHLAVADNGTDLVVAGTGMAASHDGGQSWQSVDLAGDRPVRGLVGGTDESVVVFDDADAEALATSPVGSDDWETAQAPFSAGERVGRPFAGGDIVGATVTADDSPDVVGLVARTTDSNWQRVSAPCTSRAPSVATDGTTLWYLCFSDAESTLFVADVSAGLDSPSWSTTNLPGASDAGLGAWGDGTAVAAAGKRVFRVDADGRTTDLGAGARGLDLVGDDYTVRATDKCWVVTFRGRLLHTPDDGRSWSPVRVNLR